MLCRFCYRLVVHVVPSLKNLTLASLQEHMETSYRQWHLYQPVLETTMKMFRQAHSEKNHLFTCINRLLQEKTISQQTVEELTSHNTVCLSQVTRKSSPDFFNMQFCVCRRPLLLLTSSYRVKKKESSAVILAFGSFFFNPWRHNTPNAEPSLTSISHYSPYHSHSDTHTYIPCWVITDKYFPFTQR